MPTLPSDRHALPFPEIDQTQIASVGGKGANLGELSRLDDVRVPAGFCVTTHAFRRTVAGAASIDDQLDVLSGLRPDDRDAIRARSAELRRTVEDLAVPDDVAEAITHAIVALGDDADASYAVRSSATAEDLPTASFAGQQDTYLNVIGREAILEHVRQCWASLFTERAVTYRRQSGIDERDVSMAVVVQRMVFPDVSGVLFTADPTTSNRKVVTAEASFGLGEALVAGLVNADRYQVRDGEVVARTIAAKERAVVPSVGGGTHAEAIDPARQERPALTDAQVLHLAELGRRIEAHFGRPQDIEWCLAGGDVQIVQSRPITTLFPIPRTEDGEKHVFISVGHQQMMTDALKPLGLSVWQLTAGRPMYEAGGRLFVDVARELAWPATREGLLAAFGRGDPLTGDALRAVVDRGDLLPPPPDADPPTPPLGAGGTTDPIETDSAIVDELIESGKEALVQLQRDIGATSGTALLDFIREDAGLRRTLADPRSMQVVMGGMEAAWWLNEHLQSWLGETNVADTLSQSVPNNVTSEMGLALLDVADAIRPHPEVVAYLERVERGEVPRRTFLDDLGKLEGGPAARDAIRSYLDAYGMRCVGEIDITRPRWSERPATLVPLILSNVRAFEPGAHARRFEQGRQEALQKEEEVLARLRSLPDGEAKAAETKQMIDRVRTFIGYREYPKYLIESRYFAYKQALLAEAARLVAAGVLTEPEDIFFLRFDELDDVIRTNRVDPGLIRRRKEEFASYEGLRAPRVSTSDGEVIAGSYARDDVPAGALVGLAVSAGSVEGRARVILDMAEADIAPGDILVTAATDPSWSPLFVAIAGLVTEVGGQMTHGAVIAREYGLPAVVGVEQATELIPDGRRIRVDGTRGYVEVLADA